MSAELKFHPLADLFPLLEGEEFDSLVADIAANGLREKIDLYQGKIVDGRNRYRALQRLGIDPSADQKQYFRKAIYAHSAGGEIAPHEQDNDARVRAYIISKNIHRRHLKAEDRQKFLVELVKASPEKSDRTLAKEAGTTHPTIAKARRQAEATGKALPVEKRTGADGKTRKRPAKKKRKPGSTVYWLEGVDGRSTPQRVSGEQFRAAMKAEAELMPPLAHIMTPGRDVMPTAEEAEESYQETLYDQACLILESMTDATRQRFFVHLWDKFRDELVEANTVSYERAVPNHDALYADDNAPPPEVSAEKMRAKIAALDDGLDIPESLRRATA